MRTQAGHEPIIGKTTIYSTEVYARPESCLEPGIRKKEKGKSPGRRKTTKSVVFVLGYGLVRLGAVLESEICVTTIMQVMSKGYVRIQARHEQGICKDTSMS